MRRNRSEEKKTSSENAGLVARRKADKERETEKRRVSSTEGELGKDTGLRMGLRMNGRGGGVWCLNAKLLNDEVYKRKLRLDDHLFQQYFRMSKDVFDELLGKLDYTPQSAGDCHHLRSSRRRKKTPRAKAGKAAGYVQ
ncbi:hypothetical protein NQZ68_019230 [Dissostichus eleginoides]|nr:hypothetical protein NQZ68_019230 [Dissostichus eleginoides]